MDKAKIIEFKELLTRHNETENRMHKGAFALIDDFVRRHGKDNEVDIRRFFEDDEWNERNEPTYVTVEDRHDASCLFQEKLKDIHVSQNDPDNVQVNGECLKGWANACIIPEVIDILDAIDKDIEEGLARFEDGVLFYNEDNE